MKYPADFLENGIYHAYNRTNNKEALFISDANRIFFLRQFSKYLCPFLDTFCWCLLPNHFHFLIRIKSSQEIKIYLQDISVEKRKAVEKKYLDGKVSAELLIELEWRRFFTSYAMAFNKEQGRKGNLFYRPFKRLQVEKDEYFTQLIIYIHANAQQHKICKDFRTYRWSSWSSLISDKPTQIKRDELIEWFGGLSQLIDHHQGMTEYYYSCNFAIEDYVNRRGDRRGDTSM